MVLFDGICPPKGNIPDPSIFSIALCDKGPPYRACLLNKGPLICQFQNKISHLLTSFHFSDCQASGHCLFYQKLAWHTIHFRAAPGGHEAVLHADCREVAALLLLVYLWYCRGADAQSRRSCSFVVKLKAKAKGLGLQAGRPFIISLKIKAPRGMASEERSGFIQRGRDHTSWKCSSAPNPGPPVVTGGLRITVPPGVCVMAPKPKTAIVEAGFGNVFLTDVLFSSERVHTQCPCTDLSHANVLHSLPLPHAAPRQTVQPAQPQGREAASARRPGHVCGPCTTSQPRGYHRELRPCW